MSKILQTLAAPAQASHKARSSEFICHLFPIAREDEAKALLSAHNKEFANATHNCFAYICGFGQETQYWSDAGEPHGTAGKPILNSLLRAGLTNVLAIVTRYYGGIKLGVPGLIAAYGESVELALAKAETVLARPLCAFRVTCDYSAADHLQSLVASLEGDVLETDWGQRVRLRLRVPQERLARLLEFLDGLRVQSRLDYEREET